MAKTHCISLAGRGDWEQRNDTRGTDNDNDTAPATTPCLVLPPTSSSTWPPRVPAQPPQAQPPIPFLPQIAGAPCR
ncbi:hypothetical protein HYQ46_004132 [Verticillium longisporum]|nr:hypothetical protein HYQ46_004132 [Verticillium longisporum]